jgi:hypothetical protein
MYGSEGISLLLPSEVRSVVLEQLDPRVVTVVQTVADQVSKLRLQRDLSLRHTLQDVAGRHTITSAQVDSILSCLKYSVQARVEALVILWVAISDRAHLAPLMPSLGNEGVMALMRRLGFQNVMRSVQWMFGCRFKFELQNNPDQAAAAWQLCKNAANIQPVWAAALSEVHASRVRQQQQQAATHLRKTLTLGAQPIIGPSLTSRNMLGGKTAQESSAMGTASLMPESTVLAQAGRDGLPAGESKQELPRREGQQQKLPMGEEGALSGELPVDGRQQELPEGGAVTLGSKALVEAHQQKLLEGEDAVLGIQGLVGQQGQQQQNLSEARDSRDQTGLEELGQPRATTFSRDAPSSLGQASIDGTGGEGGTVAGCLAEYKDTPEVVHVTNQMRAPSQPGPATAAGDGGSLPHVDVQDRGRKEGVGDVEMEQRATKEEAGQLRLALAAGDNGILCIKGQGDGAGRQQDEGRGGALYTPRSNKVQVQDIGGADRIHAERSMRHAEQEIDDAAALAEVAQGGRQPLHEVMTKEGIKKVLRALWSLEEPPAAVLQNILVDGEPLVGRAQVHLQHLWTDVGTRACTLHVDFIECAALGWLQCLVHDLSICWIRSDQRPRKQSLLLILAFYA